MPYLVVGAGMHGLSTAYHLAKELAARGLGAGNDIVVLDKSRAGRRGLGHRLRSRAQQLLPAGDGGADAGVRRGLGVRSGCVPLPRGRLHRARRLRARSRTWSRRSSVSSGSATGRRSIVGEKEVDAPHEGAVSGLAGEGGDRLPARASGWVCLQPRVRQGPCGKCDRARRAHPLGRRGQGVRVRRDSSIAAVLTSEGPIAVGEQVVIAPGPWAKHFWAMLELPMAIDVHLPSGDVARSQPMWTYWNLQEARSGRPRSSASPTARCHRSFTSIRTRRCTRTTESSSPTSCGGSTSSRTATASRAGVRRSKSAPSSRSIPTPRRPTSTRLPGHVVCRALARDGALRGLPAALQAARSGGLGAFTVDNFPVFDYVKPNAYCDSRLEPRYKMIGVGREVAKVVFGDHSSLLYPFRFERFETGDLHPVSSSPYPWS